MGEVNLFDVRGVDKIGLSADGLKININGNAAEMGLALDPGETGTLMVRPEFVRFMPAGETADFVVAGVLHAEYALGSRMQYEIEDASGKMLTVEKLREDRFMGSPGDKVILGFDAEAVHLINEAQHGTD